MVFRRKPLKESVYDGRRAFRFYLVPPRFVRIPQEICVCLVDFRADTRHDLHELIDR